MNMSEEARRAMIVLSEMIRSVGYMYSPDFCSFENLQKSQSAKNWLSL